MKARPFLGLWQIATLASLLKNDYLFRKVEGFSGEKFLRTCWIGLQFVCIDDAQYDDTQTAVAPGELPLVATSALSSRHANAARSNHTTNQLIFNRSHWAKNSRTKKPDISILSEDFLDEVRDMPQRSLAVELLQKLLNNEIKLCSRRSLVQSRSFAEMLEKAIIKYQNRTIEASAVIQELIELAREMREAQERGEKLGLTQDEEAFYDALGVNDSAVRVLGDDTLKTIARELVETVRSNVTIDWTAKESVRAKLRIMVKRILRKHGYPPDKQESATQTVLQQAELICADWIS